MIDSLKINAQQAAADLKNVKEAIVANGVEVPEGAHSSSYAEKVSEVYEAGASQATEEMETALDNVIAKYGLSGDII